MNKKAQGMSTNTIILLVLGLIILAALSYGFFVGFGEFQKTVGKTNVDEVAQQCKTSCSLDQKFAFCNNDIEVRIQERELKYETSCGVLSTVPEFQMMAVKPCAKIQCDVPCEDVRINGELGVIADSVKEGFHDVTAFASGVPEGKACVIPAN